MCVLMWLLGKEKKEEEGENLKNMLVFRDASSELENFQLCMHHTYMHSTSMSETIFFSLINYLH